MDPEPAAIGRQGTYYENPPPTPSAVPGGKERAGEIGYLNTSFFKDPECKCRAV